MPDFSRNQQLLLQNLFDSKTCPGNRNGNANLHTFIVTERKLKKNWKQAAS